MPGCCGQAFEPVNSLNWVQTIGILAATASTASFAPQAWKILLTRDVKGLSKSMYALTALGFALWLSFGILKGEWALIVPNAICLILSAFILIMLILPQPAR
jgi:MtN3 and saliva related transmembrane protein